MSRPHLALRDAALGYASRGIPVLPLHYPVAHPSDPSPSPRPTGQPGVGTGCSCRDPGCGQVAKHPLGSLVPHGLKDATTNRARCWPGGPATPRPTSAWPPATRFDVLDVDGPAGGRPSGAGRRPRPGQPGPLVRTGGGGWHYCEGEDARGCVLGLV